MCHFVLVLFIPFSIAITSLGEERANLSAFRTFVRFVLVWICRFPLPLGVWEGLRFVIVAFPGLFSYYYFFCIMQKNNPEIGRLIEWKILSAERPNRDLVAGESPYVRHLWLLWDQLCLKDGVLFKQWIAHSGTQVYLQLVLPLVLKKQVLASSHSTLSSAHLGVNKTVKEKIKQNFYWYRLKESVRDYIRNCVKCGARKKPARMPKSP